MTARRLLRLPLAALCLALVAGLALLALALGPGEKWARRRP